MANDLLKDIDRFLKRTGLGEHRFGILAANNGRLVERLRDGGRVWPDTEQRVRDYIAANGSHRARHSRPAPQPNEGQAA